MSENLFADTEPSEIDDAQAGRLGDGGLHRWLTGWHASDDLGTEHRSAGGGGGGSGGELWMVVHVQIEPALPNGASQLTLSGPHGTQLARIDDGSIVRGDLSQTAAKLVEQWRSLCSEELLGNWALAQEPAALNTIEPLQ